MTLYAELVSRLRTCPSLAQLSVETGTTIRWLSAVRAGAIPEPGLQRSERVLVALRRQRRKRVFKAQL